MGWLIFIDILLIIVLALMLSVTVNVHLNDETRIKIRYAGITIFSVSPEDEKHKKQKKSKLRHAEYYDMQKTFDSLYADSKSGEVFGHLMDIISAPNNIKLAFRNIKGNDGSHTAADQRS